MNNQGDDFKEMLKTWQGQLKRLLAEFQNIAQLSEGNLVVVGCSTSEVRGKRIGTEGAEEIARMIFEEMSSFQAETGAELAYQCCEHLNRALVLSRVTALRRGYEEVSVVPVKKAGGSMAAYAFQNMKDAVVVEHIKAEAGIDIGDTFIGMHLKHVAVPVRTSIREIGHAHVTMAKSRPKLIGGERAVYIDNRINKSCS
ncbi:TIGR01440 family protein [Bacillus massiliglaciei]|uniref:TIGR01440 family protein n=1 Tax=Bacillus massiliglaciei TaxID=1816693 RepID=UPI000AB28CE3|nr:TIGR01440 family protein [Bacillus massiliglaciei]